VSFRLVGLSNYCMIDFWMGGIPRSCMIDFEGGGPVGGKVAVGKSYGVRVETPKYLPYPVPTA